MCRTHDFQTRNDLRMPDRLRLLIAAVRPRRGSAVLLANTDLLAPLGPNAVLRADNINKRARHAICSRPGNSPEAIEADSAFISHSNRVRLARILAPRRPDVVEDVLGADLPQVGELDVLIAGRDIDGDLARFVSWGSVRAKISSGAVDVAVAVGDGAGEAVAVEGGVCVAGSACVGTVADGRGDVGSELVAVGESAGDRGAFPDLGVAVCHDGLGFGRGVDFAGVVRHSGGDGAAALVLTVDQGHVLGGVSTLDDAGENGGEEDRGGQN